MAPRIKRKPHKKKKYFKKIKFKSFLISLLSVFAFISLFIFLGLAFLLKDLPDIEEMAIKDVQPQVTLFDSHNTILARYGNFRGQTLTYSNIPIYMVYAVVAAEDRRFFSHNGIDIIGILRAYFVNMRAGRVVQGGSTITQQLAKIIYLSPERTFKRKLQEIIIALELERKFSKEQIMTLYLNRVYLGKGNYGIDAAARYYFGKHGSDLNIFESAIIAGLLKAPSKYSPSNNANLAITRARQVLEQMYNEGFITEQEFKHAVPPKIIDRGIGRGQLKNPYFADYIMHEVDDIIENTNEDLNVYTTLDLKAQNILEKVILHNSKLAKSQYQCNQAAGIVLEKNGAIKAMVGGVSYVESQFNRAVNAKRQPGSSFKLFVYLAGLEAGIEPENIFIDEMISLPQGKGLPMWSPRNFDRKYRGEMTFEEAFTESINTITVKISQQVGIDKVSNMAHRLGVTASIPNLSSIALGSVEMNLLEITQSYAHIANDGNKVKAYGIIKITNDKNQLIYEYAKPHFERILSIEVVEKIKEMLRLVIVKGKGKRASLNSKTAYGKTGTTQDYRDAWFIGFNDDLVTGIWMGNDDSSPTKSLVGGLLPAQTFKQFNDSVGNVEKTKVSNDSTPWRQKNIFESFIGN